MPVMFDRDIAKVFFDGIKAKKNLQHGVPQLSWWFI
jgi:hypothetical protein